jgi:hypothetical protein
MRLISSAICIGFAMVLFTTSSLRAQTTQPDAAAAAVQAATPTTQPAAPSPEQVLNQMLRGSDADNSAPISPQRPPSASNTSNAAANNDDTSVAIGGANVMIPQAVSPNGATGRILREGSEIIDRVGRLQKSPEANGWSEFVFESDGHTLRDPPMIVIPNLKLTLMETQAEKVSRDLRFRVTGTVTEYHGRNYLLLEKVVVVDDKTQDF